MKKKKMCAEYALAQFDSTSNPKSKKTVLSDNVILCILKVVTFITVFIHTEVDFEKSTSL